MSQQLQLGKYEFFPYADRRKQVPEMTTEEALKYLMASLGKSMKDKTARRHLANRPTKGR